MSIVVVETHEAPLPEEGILAMTSRVRRVRLVPDLPGVRQVRLDGAWCVQVGYLPMAPDVRFNPPEDVSEDGNVLSEALGHILATGAVTAVVFEESGLWGSIRAATARWSGACWYGRQVMPDRNDRPVWRNLPISPGDRWRQAAALLLEAGA